MVVLWFLVIMLAVVVLGYTVMNVFSRSTYVSVAEFATGKPVMAV
jgi:hypothetical protein